MKSSPSDFVGSLTYVVGAFLMLGLTSTTAADRCLVLDNGTGTVDLPAGCPYERAYGTMDIIDGLPSNTEINSDPTLDNFVITSNGLGGSLGGEFHKFTATLTLEMHGTGSLSTFTHTLNVPVSGEIHTGPRNPGDPVQTFSSDLFQLSGELFGDPYFCVFRVRAGSSLVGASSGVTELTELPASHFAVDSFFDITYEIEFEGCPEPPLSGMGGTTTATVRIQQGDAPACVTPDNGTGTVDLPVNCPLTAPDGTMDIVTGLPADSEINSDPTVHDFTITSNGPGGMLGGEYHQFTAILTLDMQGTGALSGFTHVLHVPVSGEIHTGPRNPGDPVQVFPSDLFHLSGELFGDPYFCVFRVRAGWNLVGPSPGFTTLTQQPGGDFAVDSFFDITYEIEFEGCPEPPLGGMEGTTVATVRIRQGEAPTCLASDNSTGTADLPTDCPFTAPFETMDIINGLPPDSEVNSDPTLGGIEITSNGPGGMFGGEFHKFTATLTLDMQGTGALSGFTHVLHVPVSGEIHTGPRNPGDPVQIFPSDLFHLSGELFGDPYFCVFRVRAGWNLVGPSPGYTTLTQQPGGDFAVDSFFDITYEIEFEGCPEPPLGGMEGTTRARVTLKQGDWMKADFDRDRDVDLGDYAAYGCCLAGPNAVPGSTISTAYTDCCRDTFDFDCDGDVDLADFAIFGVQFTGSR